jgi:hypothetical protein
VNRTLGIAVGMTFHGDENRSPSNGPQLDPLAELTERLKEEMRSGRNHDRIILPGVTIRMLAFYRECPDRN